MDSPGPGRPRIELDWEAFDGLCELQCTLAEFASFFKCSEDTIENRCKEQFGMNFSDVFAQRRGRGKIALRRQQWHAAEKGNVVMLIWLGKQWLGQLEKTEQVQSKPFEIKLAYNLDDDGDETENVGSDTVTEPVQSEPDTVPAQSAEGHPEKV